MSQTELWPEGVAVQSSDTKPALGDATREGSSMFAVW